MSTPIREAATTLLPKRGVVAVLMLFMTVAMSSACGNDSDSTGGSSYTNLGIRCSTSWCDPSSEVCCYNYVSGSLRHCEEPVGTTSPCSEMEQEIACDDATDCEEAGNSDFICCGAIVALNDQISHSHCADISACAGMYNHVLCDPKATMPCPSGGACRPTSMNPALGYCR